MAILFITMTVLSNATTLWSGPDNALQGDPPFGGTIFIDPDIIVSSDPTTFQSVKYIGQELRTMFDRRINDWISVNAYLFNAIFDDGISFEIQVNPEFGSADAALVEAQTADSGFISTYARDFPDREDIAEIFWM